MDLASTGNPSTSQSFTYDSDANIVSADLGGVTTTLAYSASDAPCWSVTGASSNTCSNPPSGATTYYGDANGSYTSSSTGASNSYNALGQPTSMTPAGGGALSMAYAGTDSTQRTTVGQTTLTNDIFGVASSTTAGVTSTFTRDPGGQLNSIAVGSVRYYVFYDGAGSIAGVVDAAGTQVASYAYSPYGTTTATGTNPSIDPFRFQGGYQDTSGYVKFGTRYYNPTLGIWTQLDPASVNYLQGYVFDGADPVNQIDPSGASWWNPSWFNAGYDYLTFHVSRAFLYAQGDLKSIGSVLKRVFGPGNGEEPPLPPIDPWARR